MNYIKILMAALYNVNGRYTSGVSDVAYLITNQKESMKNADIDLNCFEMCRIKSNADESVFLSKQTAKKFLRRGIPRNKCSEIYNFITFGIL